MRITQYLPTCMRCNRFEPKWSDTGEWCYRVEANMVGHGDGYGRCVAAVAFQAPQFASLA